MHLKNPKTLAATPLSGHTKTLHTLIEMGSAALGAAVSYLGKPTKISRKGQGSTLKKKKKKFLKENGRRIWGKMSGERAISRKKRRKKERKRGQSRGTGLERIARWKWESGINI